MKTNYATGHAAEKTAADYLAKNGYKIRQLNWKTRYCEIDIIAEKAKVIHFVEVKYRRTSAQGSGLDYITPSKLRQMHLAATAWAQENQWPGDYVLSAVELSGQDFRVSAFLADIT